MITSDGRPARVIDCWKDGDYDLVASPRWLSELDEVVKRLNDAFPGIKFEVQGTPKDLDGARELAAHENTSSSGGRSPWSMPSRSVERRKVPIPVSMA